ncbi:MAG: carbamoyltransferase HypF, partial [Coriobacteriaceae bacterium]|nr:carbamoyltransferase HypF [Coriobacteriaceae bacterium]
ADIAAARALCEVDAEEQALLEGTARPIVLLRRDDAAGETADGGSAASSAGGEGGADDASSAPSRAPAEDCMSAGPAAAGTTPAADVLAPSIAPGLREVGVMLPYTPLHHLLVRAAGVPLVMTSGNLSDEPIATGNAEALARLAGIADAFLMHDRGIRSRYDDSVVRVVRGRFESVRRARGYAPYPLRLPHPSDAHVLAVGPEQKNTFTLVREDLAFVSQHIGDMENAETMEGFEDTLALYERLFRIEPELVAHDLHPEYLSTKYAMTLDLPKVGVQHHHAHIAGVSGEHGVAERVIGIALDGTGYGDDGHIWGGEVLLADWCGYERFAHLREVPMPGGAGAIRRPARMAVGTLAALGLLEHPGAGPLRSRLAEGEEALLLTMVERGVNSPPTSSMGRLFDTVAALAGVRDDALYEGQAAIELEACADPSETGAYAFGLGDGAPVVIDPAPVIEALLDDMARGVQAPIVSARFHRAVVDAIVAVASAAADRTGIRTVAVAGGVFMNRLILGGTLDTLTKEGLVPLTHLNLPLNDAAVSFGQAVVACARRRAL